MSPAWNWGWTIHLSNQLETERTRNLFKKYNFPNSIWYCKNNSSTNSPVPGNLQEVRIKGVSYYQILTVAVVTALSAMTLTVKRQRRRMPHDCEHHSTKPHQAEENTCPNKDSLRWWNRWNMSETGRPYEEDPQGGVCLFIGLLGLSTIESSRNRLLPQRSASLQALTKLVLHRPRSARTEALSVIKTISPDGPPVARPGMKSVWVFVRFKIKKDICLDSDFKITVNLQYIWLSRTSYNWQYQSKMGT